MKIRVVILYGYNWMKKHCWVALAGPGCSSLGFGAMLELGPFGVKPDGKTLYSRTFAWNKGNQILFTIINYQSQSLLLSYRNTIDRYDQSPSLVITIYLHQHYYLPYHH